MNDCDVQYRQSSNKRLLVELTLIQIGQITQPEDKDVPSAGRTPHRLKSLFQKLIAPLKPASQGAGAEQKGNENVTHISAAQPSHAQTSHAPTANNENNSMGSQAKGKIKLGTLGMSFKNLEQKKEASKTFQSANDVEATLTEGDAEKTFNDEQLAGQWVGMCMRMQAVNELYGLSQRLKMLTPKITSYPQVEVVIDNPILLDEINKIKNRIRSTLAQGLQNNSITINYRVAKQAEITKIRDKREIYEDLLKNNKAFEKLVKTFKLVIN